MLWAAITTGFGPRGIYTRTLWELFWIIFYGMSATGILLAVVSSLDRRLGRFDDSAAWLCTPSRAACGDHGGLFHMGRILHSVSVLCSA